MSALLVVLAALAAVDGPAKETSVAIVISSRRDAVGQLSKDVAASLKAKLEAQGIAALNPEEATARLTKLGAVDPKACDGARLCLSKLAQLLGARGVIIGVDVGKAGRFNAGHLECVAANRVDSLAVADFTGDAKRWASTSEEALKAFITELVPKLNALAAEAEAAAAAAKPSVPPVATAPIPDAPVAPKLVPGAPPTPPLVTANPSKPWGPGVYASGGAAIVSAGVAATFLVLALGHKGEFDGSLSTVDGKSVSRLPESRLNALAAASNREFTIAATSAAATGALTGLTLYFITRDP